MIAATLTATLIVLSSAVAELPPGGGPAKTVSSMVDPLLPAELRDTVAEASKAELDPKRGPNNAVEILRSKKSEVGAKPALATALDLRIAATKLRERFLGATEFPPAKRAEQALSTFTRLDPAEPGAEVWLQRALDASPEVKRKLGKRSTWKLRTAVLTRSAALDRGVAERTFAAALEKVGVRLELVPAKEAEVVLVLGAEDAAREVGKDHAVKVTLGIELIQDKKVAWKNGIFRIEAADDPEVALKSALEWLARVGGRDLYYRWLGAKGLSGLADPLPHRPGDGHDHGPAAPKGP